MSKQRLAKRDGHYKALECYGVIGDQRTAALVAMDGSIDFMCFPEFGSPSIFAALLDYKNGGSFKIAPIMSNVEHRQLYIPDTNILLSRFLAEEGMSEVSDFMSITESDNPSTLVRRAKTVRGNIRYRMIFDPRFNYSQSGHRVEKKKDHFVFISKGDDRTVVRLYSTVPVKIVDGMAIAEFKLRTDESAAFVLEDGSRGGLSPASDPHYVSDSFKQTMNFWQGWVRKSSYRGRWREMVNRSALTLKLLISSKYGSVIAAPTFSLPEEIGGVRNWDYRYTWIRDASFSLYALMRLGYTEEATAFMRWIEARTSELEPGMPLQVMYGIDGHKDLSESILTNFEGYKKSRPVRIGNDAYKQLQLDIYGELMDSIYIYSKFGESISYDLWRHLTQLINWVCGNWERRDEGIWEVRGGAHEFLYSRVMCWVAIDRGIRLARKCSLPAPMVEWLQIRDDIYRDVYERFWDPELKTFVQYKGAKAVDASALLMPLVKFIGPTDPRWLSTLKVIQKQLLEDSLVYRYHILKGADTGFPGREGTFTACSFWNVECLARAGDVKQARFYFEKMLGYANHLGLFSEELGLSGEQLGNYPQAFTHLGLISAAYYLDRKLDQVE
jgi:GH15 family glucan-1,4-alpha-glucosidase